MLRMGVGGGLLILVAIIGVFEPRFLSAGNLSNVALQASINIVIAVGMTLVIITAGIDLSVGSIVALTAVVVADIMSKGVPPLAAAGTGLLVGCACGLINGALIVRARMAPFIVTLATLSLFRGLALVYSNGQPVYGVDQQFRSIFAGSLIGIRTPIVIAVATVAAAHFVLRRTRYGLHILAIGGDIDSAHAVGIRTGAHLVAVYVVAGFLSALGAVILVARLGAGEPIAGQGFELTAIAAAAIGGASLAGGRGSIVFGALGALIIATMQAGLTILNVQAFYQFIAVGVVILLAVGIDRGDDHEHL
jgi:ribose transport system permease protein